MTYFKINNVDFSMYVNRLKVGTKWNYKARTNASGNTSAKPINRKFILEVGIIPLDAETNKRLDEEINKFQVQVTFLCPEDNQLHTIDTIVPQHSKEYYTIQAGDTRLKAYALAFEEL